MEVRNVVVLIGRLTKDPELKYLESGTPVTNFSIAVNRSTRKPDGSFEDTLDGFFDCSMFGGAAVSTAEQFTRGSEICVVGELRQSKYKTTGQQPRTISKVEIQVRSVSIPVRAAKTESAPQQAEPQPA
jgi:single-strand DNA-binding protein